MIVSVEMNAQAMSTEDLRRARDVFDAELRHRGEAGNRAWNQLHFRLLLEQLAGSPQGRVFQEAALSSDGYVSRERVIELLGVDAPARFTGFTTPIATAVTMLGSRHPGFPLGPGPLHVDRSDGVTARSFRVDAADLPALRAALDET